MRREVDGGKKDRNRRGKRNMVENITKREKIEEEKRCKINVREIGLKNQNSLKKYMDIGSKSSTIIIM